MQTKAASIFSVVLGTRRKSSDKKRKPVRIGVGKAKDGGQTTRPERGVETCWLATGEFCLKHLGISQRA